MGTVKKTKYRYKKCPNCGKNARDDLATIYVELPDGKSVGVPDVPAICCKKCGKISIKPDSRTMIKEYVDEIIKGIDKLENDSN